MRPVRFVAAAAVALGLNVLSAARADPPKQDVFKRDFALFLDQMLQAPYAPAGVVVVAFDDSRILYERAYGVRVVGSDTPITVDTPIYNASLTKSYTGIIAAQLDAEGILPISATLSDVWPGITLPPPLDPSKADMGALLSHSSGIYDQPLEFQSNVTGEVDRTTIPAHLAKYAVPAPSFRYSNFGPFLYSTIAEIRTGERWHESIKRRVLGPLGLKATFTRVEDAPRDSLAHCHSWQAGRWNVVPLKPTPILNAAGGMYASGRDTARFMMAVMSDGRSAGGGIPAAILRRTWQRQAAQDVNFHGLLRDGYGLGWDLGAYEGERYVSRAGGFTGCRSYALFLPKQKFGIAVLNAGDLAGNTFNVAVLQQALDLRLGVADAAGRGAKRLAAFRAIAKRQADRLALPDPRVAAPPPLDPVLARIAPGEFANAAFGRFAVRRKGKGLTLSAGALIADLIPVSGTIFLAVRRGHFDEEPFEFIVESGRVTAFTWQDSRFERSRG